MLKPMRTELFQRNNMKRCGFGNPARVERDGLTGHVRKASKENIKIKIGPVHDNPSSLGPAGTVHALFESWFKFVVPVYLQLRSSQTLKDLHRSIRSKSYAGGWVRCLVFLFQQIILLTNHNNSTPFMGLLYCCEYDGSTKSFRCMDVTKPCGCPHCHEYQLRWIESDLDKLLLPSWVTLTIMHIFHSAQPAHRSLKRRI